MQKLWIYWLGMVFIGFSACEWRESEPPTQDFFSDTLSPKLSYWNLPLVLGVDKIEKKINQKVRGTIYVDSSFSNNNNDSIKLKIRKIGNIKLSVKEDQIHWEVPLKVFFDGFVEKKVGDVILQSYQIIDFSAKLYFESKVSISKDWRLQTSSSLKDIFWLKKPRIKLAFINLTIGKAVEKVIREKEDKLLEKLDGVIRRQVNIKKHVAKVWKDIQKPILISKKFQPIWLMAQPQSLEVEGIEGIGQRIYIRSRIGLMLETKMGSPPPVVINETLPEAIKLGKQKFPNSFDLQLLSEISYDHINQLLADSLKDRAFTLEDYLIIIERAEIYGRGQHLIIKIDIGGDTEGQMFFKGIPQYDPQLGALKIKDFDFDLQQGETITIVADWLLHDMFRINIQQKLVLPLGNHIDRIPSLISEAIEKDKVGEKISVTINRLNLTSSDIMVLPESIQMMVRIQGNAEIELEKL